MQNKSKSSRKPGSVAPSVLQHNNAQVGNIAALSGPRKSPWMLLRFEGDHVGKFHFTQKRAAQDQFENSRGRRHLVSHELKATWARAE